MTALDERLAVIETDIKYMREQSKATAENVEKIMTNHLPHIQASVTALEQNCALHKLSDKKDREYNGKLTVKERIAIYTAMVGLLGLLGVELLRGIFSWMIH